MAAYLAYVATRRVRHIGAWISTGDGFSGAYRAICGSRVKPSYKGISARLLFASVPEHTLDPRYGRPLCKACVAEARTIQRAAGLDKAWR